MKKLFTRPEIEVVKFTQLEDILATNSGVPKEPDDIIDTPVDDIEW